MLLGVFVLLASQHTVYSFLWHFFVILKPALAPRTLSEHLMYHFLYTYYAQRDTIDRGLMEGDKYTLICALHCK